MRDLYLLAFIHVGSRRVWVSPATAHPTGAWVQQQARNFNMWRDEQGMEASHLIRDRDGKFTAGFDRTIESMGAEIVRLPPRSPNLNAYCERFVQSLKHECLDHFIIFGEKHLNHLAREYLAYYHIERPHQGKGNALLFPTKQAHPADGQLCCDERLGGLLKHYYRAAA